jgi:hypothetical protein
MRRKHLEKLERAKQSLTAAEFDGIGNTSADQGQGEEGL